MKPERLKGTGTPRLRRLLRLSSVQERRALNFLISWCFVSSLAASTIEGRVMNDTQGKPSAGDQVVLYRIDNSMHEQARTTSDRRGAFRFTVGNEMAHLIAVIHQGISYHSKVFKDGSAITIPVFDTTNDTQSSQEDSETLFFETQENTLTVTQFFAVSNRSDPARTLAASKTFDFELPKRGILDSVAVQPPGTLPLTTQAFPLDSQQRYGIGYPLRPGTTKIRVVYHLAYSGRASLRLHTLRRLPAMALMVPASMRLSGAQGDFSRREPENGLSVYVAENVPRGRSLDFAVSGMGQLKSANAAPASRDTSAPLAASVPDFLVVTPPQQELEDTARRSAVLKYQLPVVLMALLISVAALNRRHRVLSHRILSQKTGPGGNDTRQREHQT